MKDFSLLPSQLGAFNKPRFNCPFRIHMGGQVMPGTDILIIVRSALYFIFAKKVYISILFHFHDCSDKLGSVIVHHSCKFCFQMEEKFIDNCGFLFHCSLEYQKDANYTFFSLPCRMYRSRW